MSSKKLFAMLLSLSLAASMTGCSSQTGTDTAETTGAQATESTAEASSDEGRGAEASASYSTNIVIDADTEITSTINGLSDGLCSWTQGGQDAGTTAGDDYAFAPVVYINDDSFDSEKSLTEEALASDELTGTSIEINQDAVNGVIVNNSDYTIEDSDIEVNADEADGSTTCDFSGLGSAVAVYGSSNVTIRNSILKASGVADMGIFVDNGATALLDHVTMSSAGGTLYSGYVNSPAQETMVAPPWILGIMGNSRCSNLMGDNSTLTVLDSDTSASNWAVLSTDSGSNMALNVVNSSLTLTGSDQSIQADGKYDTENPYTSRSGYGTYVIGNSVETFLGDTLNVGTYAAIFTGGTATYGNLQKGESYELLASDGSTHTTYEATEDVQTVINSDTFGFMAHQNTNSCTLDGVQVNSAFTDFLVKSGCDTTITVENGAQLNPGNGILLQLLDNDDSTTEYDSESQAFGETHEEYAGFPTEAVADSSTAADHMQPSDLPDSDGNGQASGSSDDNGQGQAPDGNGQAPGSSDNNGQAPGSSDNNGQAPGSSDGSGQTPPDKPSGDAGSSDNGSSQTPPEMPSGDADSSDMPSGDAPSGDMPSGGSADTQNNSADAQSGGDSSSNTTVYNVIDTDLEGAIYNGIGWNANDLSSGNVKQMQLQVNLSGTSTLKGAIAMTSCIHVTYDGQTYLKENGITAFNDDTEAAAFADQYQSTSFSQSEYFNIGQVANLVKSNGLNNIDVTLADSAVWTVTDTSLVSSVTLSGDAQVIVEKGVTLTVNGKEYSEGTYGAEDF